MFASYAQFFLRWHMHPSKLGEDKKKKNKVKPAWERTTHVRVLRV